MTQILTKKNRTVKTPERLAYDDLNRKGQVRVMEVYCKSMGCDKTTFFRKLNGKTRVRPHEKKELQKLLNL